MPIETLVSIMPLVENRDHWKLRALIAEGKLAEAEGPRDPTDGGNTVSYNYTSSDCDLLNGSLYNVWRQAFMAFTYALLDAKAATAHIDERGHLKLECIALIGRVGALRANETYDLVKAAVGVKP